MNIYIRNEYRSILLKYSFFSYSIWQGSVISVMLFTQLSVRNGILPLQLEVVRGTNKAVEDRLWLICNNCTVEDEEDFLFHCNFYYSERQDFFNYMKNNILNFNILSIEHKLQTIMTKEHVQILISVYGKFTKWDRTNYLFNYDK